MIRLDPLILSSQPATLRGERLSNRWLGRRLERFRNQILTRPSNEERAPLAPRRNCSPGRAHGEAPSVVRDGQAVNAIVLEICPAVSEVTRVGPLQLAFGSEVTARAGALIDIDTGTVRCEESASTSKGSTYQRARAPLSTTSFLTDHLKTRLRNLSIDTRHVQILTVYSEVCQVVVRTLPKA